MIIGHCIMIIYLQTTPNSSTLACPTFLNNKYIPEYSCRMELESVCLGFVSLSLTILNIICIFFVGIIFLKVRLVKMLKKIISTVNLAHCVHLYYSVMCIKRSPFSCPVIGNFIWIDPLNTGLTVYLFH